ncbi:MAG: hypothetical protein A3I73_03730 [Omnitrophica bacterium RIFCSPLOWO2_02_FULL_45_16]|nr:MAG: hypothetical protein A3C51_04625 [Omnitrophica bacterium RIFCSPHIGHO2_02_FULL_46_20]OGW93078.1 MAG: hypothetical protein A3G36_01730 [Omnitrophica bacterium RIFCSPLOWO2_12_FULL_45_13]OGW94321.1 MAG: hypothetical protein A3K16_00285 [Omnitrophica bacterium RIFCSPLOWO2_01_FULL_45_24]OGX01418.1 MAG: hypothetical protein A3I73_03730 [Omnitrophica bacterium RIFCSPLOWO2_02_FULL_45_16]
MGEAMNRTKIFEKYQNKWVALTSDDKIISAGTTIKEVLAKAIQKGFKDPIIAKMPDLKFDYLL